MGRLPTPHDKRSKTGKMGGGTPMKAASAGGEKACARGAQGPHEKTTGQGEFIGNKGVLVFD